MLTGPVSLPPLDIPPVEPRSKKISFDFVLSILTGWDDVVSVVDFRTVYFGPDQVLVTADVSFDPDLDTGEIDERISGIERHIKNTYESVRKVYIEPEA